MVASGAQVVGGCGLHRRKGPACLDIGYWVHVGCTRVGCTRLGYATAAAAALSRTALVVSGVERVEIRCDAGNVASARVKEAPTRRDGVRRPLG